MLTKGISKQKQQLTIMMTGPGWEHKPYIISILALPLFAHTFHQTFNVVSKCFVFSNHDVMMVSSKPGCNIRLSGLVPVHIAKKQ